MRYTEKQHREAILICAIAASNPDLGCRYQDVCAALGWRVTDGEQSFDLAVLAWCETFNVSCCDAEAECLLRDGWSPGDPVEVRNGR